MSIAGQKRKSSSALDGTPRLTTRVGDCDPTPYRRKDVLFGGTAASNCSKNPRTPLLLRTKLM